MLFTPDSSRPKKVRIQKELMFARLRVDRFCGRSTKPREDMKKTGVGEREGRRRN